MSTGTAAIVVGGAGMGLSAKSYSQVIGANERINVAVIGVRGHGRTHISAYKKMPDDVRIAALCDCDSAILNRELSLLEKDNIKAKGYIDLRKLYEDKDIDAVSVVTPNYWHALATVWACQAGKHVCVEKPVSHSIWEGRQMVEAARKYKRLVQADLDCRSDLNIVAGIEYMQKNLGKILYVRVVNYKRRKSIGKIMGPGAIPDNVDYDLFTGPTPMMPLPRKELHYDWHWQWLTGNCEIGNNGPHQLDMCRWALGKSNLPKTVLSFGGRFGYVDDGNVPNTQVAWYDYDGIPVIYDSRALGEKTGIDNMDGFTGYTATGKKVYHPYKGDANCDLFIFCENGYLNMDKIYDNDGNLVKQIKESGTVGPQFNFIKALKSGKKEDLRTDILEGHLSTSICHIGNIAYQTGKQVSLDELKKTVEQYKYLNDVFLGFEEHLRVNGINVAKEELYLGQPLTFDSVSEKFVGQNSAMANRFLKDTYREPFVIPEKV
jgi:predicted dehydrogenase